MKNVLFITHHFIDGNGGGCYASRAYINAFAELFDVTLIYPIKDGKDAKYINDKVKKIPVPYDKSRWGKLTDLLIGRVHRYYNYIKSVELEKYDIVVFDTSVVSFGLIKLAKFFGCKTICIHHNYQYEYFKDNTSFPLLLPTLYWCKQYEKEAVVGCDLNLTISPQDKNLLTEHYGGESPIEVIGCFEYEKDKEIKINESWGRTEKRFVITGNLSAVQTEVSLQKWFEQYWSLFVKECADARLTIAGKSPSSQLMERCAHLGISIIPSPEDMSIIIKDADYYICPTSLGGGLKLRIMDGLRAGLPVITHEVSARGYDLFKDKCLFVYSDSDSFIKALKDACGCGLSSKEIMELYKETFSFNAGVNRLRTILEKYRFLYKKG